MRVLRRPRQYTLLASLILLAVPVFLLNIWVMQKGVLAKVISPDKLIWMGVQAFWVLLTLRWLLRATWTGFWAFIFMSVVLLGGNLFFLIDLKNYALAFYALFLLILAGLYSLHLFRSLKEAYYHPGQHWYEGRPVFLPRIEAMVRTGDKTVPVRLSRLGIEGCYAFAAGPDGAQALTDTIDAIALKLDDLNLDCAVELISKTKDGTGRGLRFLAGSADQDKDIRDFIDRVRSSGYVA